MFGILNLFYNLKVELLHPLYVFDSSQFFSFILLFFLSKFPCFVFQLTDAFYFIQSAFEPFQFIFQISVWYFCKFSISLFKFSLCSTSFLLSLLSIYMIISLNFLNQADCLSVIHLVLFLRFLLCFFLWNILLCLLILSNSLCLFLWVR